MILKVGTAVHLQLTYSLYVATPTWAYQCSYQDLTAEGHIKFNDVSFTNN